MKLWLMDWIVRWKVWRYECDIYFLKKRLLWAKLDLYEISKEAERLGQIDCALLAKGIGARIAIMLEKGI